MQYAEVVGLPAMHAYWTLGLHQCKFGYRDVKTLDGVVAGYSTADIPLETMWTDIDYMEDFKVFTLDPKRFPLNQMQSFLANLRKIGKHYIMMVDPAVAYQNYSAFTNGVEMDVFVKNSKGSIFKGVVWPGVTAYPDWFAPNTQTYWNEQFEDFFHPTTGVDIDGLWIDMNEATNFCDWPCKEHQELASRGDTPSPALPPTLFSDSPQSDEAAFLSGPRTISSRLRNTVRQATGSKGNKTGLTGRDLIDPAYKIKNAAGSLSNKTIFSDALHYGGYVEYDVHNLYGTMMSTASRHAMLNRRPKQRPFVITRSTFAGAGKHVGHWLGDNLAAWDHYRFSIAQLLSFTSLFQVPMVGTDACGFAGDTTPNLCARWASLAAFSPFFRNHANSGVTDHEFYRWPIVAESARKATNTRYQLLDYIYTALHRQTVSGTPLIYPLWFQYPEDKNTFAIDLQYFYGDAILVSPVTEQDKTSVKAYFPHDLFYDFWNHQAVHGNGSWITLTDVPLSSIPLHIKGGSIIPLRVSSAESTARLRQKNFEVLIALDYAGKATGKLYLDEGNDIDQPKTSQITFTYDRGLFLLNGNLGYPTDVKIEKITLLNAGNATDMGSGFAATEQSWKVEIPLTSAGSTRLV